MHNRPPLQEEFGSGGWRNWFTQLFQCIPWKKALNVKATLDFPSISGSSESAGIVVTVTGARQGDAVSVTPYSNTTGISYKGIVTANDIVTVYAMNCLTGVVNPNPMQFRIIVIQD